MHVYRFKTLVSYYFIKKEKLFKPRISLLIALIFIRSNNICETGVFKDIFKDKSFVNNI
jgi:hypothetical protein